MDLARFEKITNRYPRLRVAIIGDFCLDRYLEVDPTRQELSIETGLPVHNVINVRSQPGGAGTILNNLAALGVGEIHPVGFCGEDGEGFELRLALQSRPGVRLGHFLATNLRRLLAPYFGTSLFIWAILIGLVMIYLAVGYGVGGRLADRFPSASVLYGITGVAGFSVGLKEVQAQ